MDEIKRSTDNSSVAVNSTPAQKLFEKDVSRKEFLSIAGFGVLGVIGMAPLVHFLTGKGSSKLPIHANYAKAMGTTVYSRGKYNQ